MNAHLQGNFRVEAQVNFKVYAHLFGKFRLCARLRGKLEFRVQGAWPGQLCAKPTYVPAVLLPLPCTQGQVARQRLGTLPSCRSCTQPHSACWPCVHPCTSLAAPVSIPKVSCCPVSTRGELRGPNLGKVDSNERSCVFHALFRPSDQLALQTLQLRR